MKIFFNFYGFTICVEGDEEIVCKIRKDFSFFYSDEGADPVFNIELDRTQPDFDEIPSGLVSFSLHPQFDMYIDKHKRYVDYNGKGLSVYDMEDGVIRIISGHDDLLHELGYLAVHSAAGRMFERRQMFRIHGLSFSYKNRGVMLVSDTGGGKTVLLLELLKRTGLFFLGDEVVLVDNKLQMLPFPTRFGLKEDDRSMFSGFPAECIYELKRRKYGKKILLDTACLRSQISGKIGTDLILIGKKWNNGHCRIKRAGSFRVFSCLIRNLVVGIGLPQLIEYMNLEFSITDVFKLSRKVLRRMVFSFRLVREAGGYLVYMGPDSTKNAQTIIELLGN